MTTRTWAAVFLIAAPLWFNLTFAMLAKRFDYPDILRRPTDEILERFRAGGPSLILLWWAFMLSGLLMIVATVLLGQVLGFTGIVPVATTIGVRRASSRWWDCSGGSTSSPRSHEHVRTPPSGRSNGR